MISVLTTFQAILNVILPDIQGAEIGKTIGQNLDQNTFKWVKTEPEIIHQREEDQFFAPPDVTFGTTSDLEVAKIVNLSSLMFDSLTGLKDEPNYYMHIANNGYTYESCLVFMPMYPLSIRSITDAIYRLYENHAYWVNANIITYSTLLLICAQLVNIITFTIAADRYKCKLGIFGLCFIIIFQRVTDKLLILIFYLQIISSLPVDSSRRVFGL